MMSGSVQGTDVVVSGNLTTGKAFGATIGAHNAALNNWAKLSIQPEGSSNVIIGENSNGYVGIGIGNPQSKLAVNGTITAKELVITLAGFADHVFDETYKLSPLSEVEAHIKQKKHLPGIPSEQEVIKNGMSTGAMVVKHMEKIEELTLYAIEADRQLLGLKKENEMLMDRLTILETFVYRMGAAK